MKHILMDIVKQTSPHFDKVRVTGTDTGTTVEAYSEDKMLFLVAELKEAVPEFKGQFGINSLPILNGLLNVPTYKTDEAKFAVRRNERDGQEYVSEFEFRDKDGANVRFRTMNPKLVGDQAKIANIPWDISVPLSKSKITEVVQLAGLLASATEGNFGLRVEGGTLFLTLGRKSAASHTGSVALATEVEGQVPASNTVFKVPQFLAVLKNVGNHPCTVRFSQKGVGGVRVETEHGTYNYYMRASEG